MELATKLIGRFKYQLVGKLINILSGAVLIIALARLLSPDTYGLFYLAISIFGVARVFSRMGVAKSAARYIATYKEEDYGQIPHILRLTLYLSILCIAATALLLYFLSGTIAGYLDQPSLKPLLALGVFYVCFQTTFSNVLTVLQGFERIKATATLRSIIGITRLVLTLLLVVLGLGAVGALAGYVASAVLTSVIGVVFIYKYYYLGVQQSGIEPDLRRNLVEYSLPLTITDSANLIDKRVDTILVGLFIGPAGVAFYTVGKQISKFVEAPMTSLGFTLAPTFEAERAKGNQKNAQEIFEVSIKYGLLLYLPASVGLILVSGQLITSLFGEGYADAIPVIQVLSLFIVLQSITRLTNNALDYLGRGKQRAVLKTFTSLMNLGLNVLLLPLMGVVGAAVATVTTQLIYTSVTVHMVDDELGLDFSILFYHVVKVLVVSAVMAVPVYATTIVSSGPVSLFLSVGIGVASWAILALSFDLVNLEMITEHV